MQMHDADRRAAERLIELGHAAVTWSNDASARVQFAEALALVDARADMADLLARALAGLAQLCRARGDIAEADELVRRAQDALASTERLGGVDPLAALEVALEAAESTDCEDPAATLRAALGWAGSIADPAVREDAIVRALRTLGGHQRALGQYAAAASTLREALDAATARFGPDSLERAGVLNELGVVAKFSGAWDDAARCYAEVQSIQDAHGLDGSSDRATLLHNLGGLEHARGNLEQAEPLARQSVDLHARTLGDTHLATDLDRIALAAILDGIGQRMEAAELLEGVIPRLRSRLGDDPEVAVALNNLGAIAQRSGDLDRAEASYREALAIKEARVGSSSPTLAATLNNLGTVLRRTGRLPEAAAMYARAIELLEGVVDDDHPTLGALRRNMRKLDRP